MLTTQEGSRSLADFARNPAETIDRINQTGAAEILTVDGEARAVLVSPDLYKLLRREADLAADAAIIRQSIKDSEAGLGRDASEFFDELHAKLLAMAAAADAEKIR